MVERVMVLEHALRRPATLMAEAGIVGEVARTEVSAALARYLRPLEITVTGRAGSGRHTAARALRNRLGVVAGVEMAGADLRCHVLAGPPRAADLRVLDAGGLPTVVILGKADLLDPGDVVDLRRRCGAELGCSVLDVVALWATPDLDEDDLRLLSALAAAGECVPSMAAQFTIPVGIAADDPGTERHGRTRLLQRLGPAGVEMALDILARADTADPEVLRERIVAALAATSGLDQLQSTIVGHVDGIRLARLADLRARISRLAAAGVERSAMERLLGEGWR